MGMMSSGRGLPVLLAVLAIVFGGCLGRSPSPVFYTLSPMEPHQAFATPGSAAQNAVIGIGPLKIADYLDQPDLVTRSSSNQVVKSEYDRWAGSFKNDFMNVLAENIGLLVPTKRIYLFPWRTSVPLDYQVVVDVVRLDGRLGEAAWLVARWSVLGGSEKKLINMNQSRITEPVTGPDYAALVAAQSRALAKLSQEIAQAIQGAKKH